jgi:flavin reductase (DIM6/NTAB) family NADH-FMN oxidoreductase RutF
MTQTNADAIAAPDPHVQIDPSILYVGTPVVLISTRNEDGSHNLMPMSSVFFLGHTGLLGFGRRSQTWANLVREKECVLNFPSADMVTAVDRLALTTGRDPVPEVKREVGYRHVRDKFAHAGLTPLASATVGAMRVAECPIAMEAIVTELRPIGEDHPAGAASVEVEVSRVHVHESVRTAGHADRIDPDLWRPLVMSFQKFYGLGPQVHPSRLSTIDEEWYR